MQIIDSFFMMQSLSIEQQQRLIDFLRRAEEKYNMQSLSLDQQQDRINILLEYNGKYDSHLFSPVEREWLIAFLTKIEDENKSVYDMKITFQYEDRSLCAFRYKSQGPYHVQMNKDEYKALNGTYSTYAELERALENMQDQERCDQTKPMCLGCRWNRSGYGRGSSWCERFTTWRDIRIDLENNQITKRITWTYLEPIGHISF